MASAGVKRIREDVIFSFFSTGLNPNSFLIRGREGR